MLLSAALGINLNQPLLDFVDIDLNLDFPLYLDPLGFIDPQDRFASECQDDIRDFFEAVLKAIIDGDLEKGETLLAALQEPNETPFWSIGRRAARPRHWPTTSASDFGKSSRQPGSANWPAP